MAKIDATITVKNDETGGPLGGVEVELSNVDKKQTGADGTAHFQVDEGTGYDLKVRNDALRPTYKNEGDFWLTEVVNSLPDTQRGRFKMLPGEAVVWGVTFSTSETNYDVPMRRQLQHGGAISATPGGKVLFDKAALEVVIVAGTNLHDNTWGNKMMFLAQAVRAVRAQYASEAYLSVLVFPDGYTAEEVAETKKSVLGYNGKAIFVSLASKDELVSYLNTRTTDGSYDYRGNERILLKEVLIFAHRRPNIFFFGMQVPRESDLDFAVADVASLKPEAWNPGAVLSSYACRTGNGDPDGDNYGDDWKTVIKPEASMAQKIAEQLGVKVRGYVTRSSYQPTWAEDESSDDTAKAAYKTGYKQLSDPGVTTAAGFHPMSDAKPDFAQWNQKGAWAEPKSKENSPKGLTSARGAVGMWVFEKGKDPTRE
jgi:hypothetical protein